MNTSRLLWIMVTASMTALWGGCATAVISKIKHAQIAEANSWLGRSRSDLPPGPTKIEPLAEGGESLIYAIFVTDAGGGMHSITYFTNRAGKIERWRVDGPGYSSTKSLSKL